MTTPTTSSTEMREWDQHLTSRAERTAFGKALRSKAPRSSHAAWVPHPERPDPISLLEEANTNAVKALGPDPLWTHGDVPIRVLSRLSRHHGA